MLDAAARGGASRVVHLSSVTVFGFAFPDGVDESYPTEPNGVPYVDTKVASEALVLRAHAAGDVACAIVRPGDVYGPRSRPWTLLPVEEIRRRRFVLPARGRGIFCPCTSTTWSTGSPGRDAPGAAARAASSRSPTATGVTTASSSGTTRGCSGGALPTLPTGPSRALASAAAFGARVARQETEVNAAAAQYLARTGTYSIDRARSVLGYAPAVRLADGMARTEAWLRAEGHVPRARLARDAPRRARPRPSEDPARPRARAVRRRPPAVGRARRARVARAAARRADAVDGQVGGRHAGLPRPGARRARDRRRRRRVRRRRAGRHGVDARPLAGADGRGDHPRAPRPRRDHHHDAHRGRDRGRRGAGRGASACPPGSSR